MGAAAALELAQRNPFLTGAVLAAEFALPVAALQAAGAAGGSGGGAERGGGEARQALSSSRQLLPWWGFRAGQASSFPSVEHCAAFLAHPLASLAPGILEPLAQAARQAAAGAGAGTASDDAQAGAEPPLSQLLAQLHRPLRGAVAAACSLLRLPPGPAGGGGGPQFDGWDDDGGPAGLEPRMDPSLLFSFDPAALLAGLPDMRCHLLLLRGGGPGSWVDAADADATARLAAGSRAASAAAAELPGAGHWLASDHPDALLRQIVTFLEGPAIRCFERQPLPDARGGGDTAAAADGGARRPEVLGLKPLPEYASLEEAKKVRAPAEGFWRV